MAASTDGHKVLQDLIVLANTPYRYLSAITGHHTSSRKTLTS